MKRSTIPAILLGLLAASASAQTPITWNNTGTDWATGGNWTGGVAPTNSITANIAEFASTTTVPTWGSALSIAGMSFTAAGTYTIGSGGVNVNMNVGASGLNFGNNAVTLNINDSSFNQNLRLGGTGVDSGVTTGSGAVTIRATTTANQYLLTIENGRTATFNIGAGGLTMGGNSGTGSTRQAIAFGNSSSTLLKTGSGAIFFNNSSVSGSPGLATGIYDIRQGSIEVDANNGNFFGSSTITLGDNGGSSNSMLLIQRVGTFNNALTVRSGSAGTKTFAVRYQDQAISGGMTLNDALTFEMRHNAAGTLNVTNNGAISGAGTLNVRATNITAGVATGNLTLNAGNTSWTGSLNVGNASSDANKVANVIIGVTNALTASNAVTVNHQGTLRLAGNSVTIGSLAGGGTSSFVENANAANATLTLNVGGTVDTNYAGVVRDGTGGGTLSLTKAGTGTNRLTGANTFSGSVSITGGELIVNQTGLGATNAVDVSSGASFKTAMGNNTLTIGALSGAGRVRGSLGASANSVLVLNGGSANSDFSGVIDQEFSGTFAIQKAGSGTQTFSGASANTYTGATTVNGGTLRLNKTAGVNAIAGNVAVNTGAKLLISTSNQVANSSAVTLSGGTIQRGSGVSEAFGTLTLSGLGSSLDFGGVAESNFLQFTTFTPGAFTLNVANFLNGNELRYNAASLAAGQSLLTSSITFTASDSYTTSFGGGVFTITAIPEPSTIAAAVGLLGLLLAPLARRRLTGGRLH